jgi:chromosome partitioning protein
MGRTVAVVNQKGGVGKSTTAVNLGACLALLGKRVLLVDIDPQGNATTGLGIDKRGIENDSYALLLGEIPAASAIVASEVENLWLIPATPNLAGAEVELVSALARENRLRQALADIANQYDYIFVDCPPSLGLLTINALVAADQMIIPIQAEFYALEGLSQLTTIVRRVKEALNPGLEILGVLVTMFDGRTRLAVDVLDEVVRYFPEQVFKTQIPRNIRLSEAPSFGKPVVLFDVKSRGAQAYLDLAREVAALESVS